MKIKKFRWIEKHCDEYKGWIIETEDKKVFRYKAYLSCMAFGDKEDKKIEIDNTLEEINKILGDMFYKDIIRDEKIKELGL